MPKNNATFSEKDFGLLKMFFEGTYDEDTMGANTNTIKGDEIQVLFIGSFDTLWIQAPDGKDLYSYELGMYTDDEEPDYCGEVNIHRKGLSKSNLKLLNRIQELRKEFQPPISIAPDMNWLRCLPQL